MTSFSKDFDAIFYDVLTDYENLDSAPDTSQGSTAYIMGSVLSSGLWGLYRFQDYIAKQQFPDTADTVNLNHWGYVYDVARGSGDTDAEYVQDILSFLRQPPAGGNALDFKTWALDEDNSKYETGGVTYYNVNATVEDWPDDIPGTVETFTVPNDESIIGTATGEALRAATEAYIGTKRPIGMKAQAVTESVKTTQNVTISVTAPATGSVDVSLIETAIETELDGMEPGEDLYLSTLYYICKSYGAENATISVPATDVTVANDNFIRAGTVVVTEA